MERDIIDKRFLQYWNNYKLKNGILYRETNINGEKIEQLVLPASLAENIFRSYHDDLGHQGRDRTTSLIRRRFVWSGMNKYIDVMVKLLHDVFREKRLPFVRRDW